MPGIDFSVHATNPIALGPAPAIAKAKSEDDGFGFDDLLDIVNPLHHIPVVSTLYRHLTGDKIGVGEKIAGGALYGGLTGLVCSLGDALFEEITGKNVGDTIYAFVVGEDEPAAVAAAPVTPAAATPALVTPASSLDIALPSFSFLNEPVVTANTRETAQRATTAYRSAQRTLQAY